MAELDTIVLYNPTSKDFTHNFNGEPYTIEAKSTKAFSQWSGVHLAKHLATRIITEQINKKYSGKKIEIEEARKKGVELSQGINYDNPKLRIALYTILNDIKAVELVVTRYPYKGFVGDMKTYERFVKEREAKLEEKEEKPKEEDNNN